MKHKLKAIKNFFKNLGPGFITGAADNDPSGYSQLARKPVRNLALPNYGRHYLCCP